MLVSFLGAPCSGKTTCAARLFADLKDSGISAEFVTEYAREFIAVNRVFLKQNPVELVDTDQAAIMHGQFMKEDLMVKACGKDVVVVCDSSPLNTLMYISDEYLEFQKRWLKQIVKDTLVNIDVAFLCSPIGQTIKDPNRIHDIGEIDGLQVRLIKLLSEWAPNLKYHSLKGDSSYCYEQVSRIVKDRLHV